MKEVTVLWNGGWDTYVVNPTELTETPQKEEEGNSRFFPTWHEGPNSGTPCWLKCRFIPDRYSIGTPGQSVRVVRRIRGGD